jgi:hypothetical protein
MSLVSLPPLSCVPFFPHDRVAVIAHGVIYRLGSLLPRAKAIPAFLGRLRDDDTSWKKHFLPRSRILIILPSCSVINQLKLLRLIQNFTHTCSDASRICQLRRGLQGSRAESTLRNDICTV